MTQSHMSVRQTNAMTIGSDRPTENEPPTRGRGFFRTKLYNPLLVTYYERVLLYLI